MVKKAVVGVALGVLAIFLVGCEEEPPPVQEDVCYLITEDGETFQVEVDDPDLCSSLTIEEEGDGWAVFEDGSEFELDIDIYPMPTNPKRPRRPEDTTSNNGNRGGSTTSGSNSGGRGGGSTASSGSGGRSGGSSSTGTSGGGVRGGRR